MNKTSVDYSIYVITDDHLSRGRRSSDIIRQAINGGATIIQYREKRGQSTRNMLETISTIQQVTRASGIPLIINDRLDLALASDADGLHLGQDDLPIAIARKYLGYSKIIGISVHSSEEAEEAIENGADYIAVSGVFRTATKPDIEQSLGLDCLRTISQMSSVPVIGIGGIHPGNVRDVILSGADGVAVVSWVVSADHPADAAADLAKAIRSVRITR